MTAFRRTTRRRGIAWLASVALWLSIVAPVISQALPAASGFDLGAWCTSHGLDEHHHAAPGEPMAPLDHCGYCGLLGHSPLLPGVASLELPAADLHDLAPAAPAAQAAPRPRVLSAPARGPPATC